MAIVLAMTPGAVRGQLSVVPGPVEADVTKVTDGDTMNVVAYPFPDEATWRTIRVRGIDTPENRSRCKREKDLAAAAKAHVEQLVNGQNGRVKLRTIGCNAAEGAGFGRCLSDVQIGNVDLATEMIAKGFARPNFGEARLPWCP